MFKSEKESKILWYLLLGVVIAIIIFLHLYKLADIPYGLNVDEVGSAYDAYCIETYGVDRYGKSFPVYFTNYGDGQNALYTYMTALFFCLFGTSKFVVRMGIALSSLTGALFCFLFARSKWKNTKVPVLLLCLYAILPIFTLTQRFGLESHLMLSASIVVLYTSLKALDTEKWQYYLFAGIVMGLSLYTYALIYIVLPIYLLLWLAYGFYLRKIRIRKLPLLFLPLALAAAPLIMVQVINIFSLPELRIGPFTFTRLLKYRSKELGFQDVFRNLKQMFTNTLFYDDLTFNTIPRYGTIYYFSLPFLFIGLVVTIKETVRSLKLRRSDASALIFFWLFGEFIMGCLLKGWSTPNTTRMIGIYTVYLYFITHGIYSVWGFLKKTWQKRTFAGILAGLYAVSFFSFAHYYFMEFNQKAFPLNWLFYETYDEISALLEEHQDKDWASRAICYPYNYVYYLWSYKINPYEMNIPANGHEKFGEDLINEYPGNVQIKKNYVVYYTGQASIDLLTQLGYVPVEMEKFIFFISPLEKYDLTVMQQQSFYIDGFQVVDEKIKLSGWCVDTETDTVFTGYLLETDDTIIEVQKTERQDVADVFSREDYRESGFTAELPLDTLVTCDSLTLTGIRADGSGEIIYQITRKDNIAFP